MLTALSKEMHERITTLLLKLRVQAEVDAAFLCDRAGHIWGQHCDENCHNEDNIAALRDAVKAHRTIFRHKVAAGEEHAKSATLIVAILGAVGIVF